MTRRFAKVSVLATICAVLFGCANGSLLEKGLDFVGLMKRPDASPPEMPGIANGELLTSNGQMPALPPQRQVALRIHAGQVLNLDVSGRSLALVLRVYRLRGTTQFTQATSAMFVASSGDHPVGGDDVISSKEIVLVPGQKYEMIESLPHEATHLAVVALFRAPDRSRWRFVFEVKSAATTGITLGAHGCAMSVAAGDALGASPETLRLAGAQCG